MKDIFFFSDTTEERYEIQPWSSTMLGRKDSIMDGDPTPGEVEVVLLELLEYEWRLALKFLRAGVKTSTLGISKPLWMNEDIKVVCETCSFGLSDSYGALLPLFKQACGLREKREALEVKVKGTVSIDHPMVVAAKKMARHLGHGWSRFEGKTLLEVEEGMEQQDRKKFGDPGKMPPLNVYGRQDGRYDYRDSSMVEKYSNTVYMSDKSETGRYDWWVTWDGILHCDICRPDGVAIHIVVQPGGSAVEVTKGTADFEDRHIYHAVGVIEACAGYYFVRPAMTKLLLSTDAFDAWQNRCQEAEANQ